MYKIHYIGDPVLRRKTEKIVIFDKHLQDMVKNMIKTMHREEGIGLAAPQIGQSKKVLVIDISPLEEDHQPQAFINPEILEKEGESTVEEGCLSIPEVREEVIRPEKIRLKYRDESGEEHDEYYDGWMARVLQHEIDHLNGILFVDHISPVKRRLFIETKLIPEKY